MTPTQRLDDRPRLALRPIKPVVTAIGVGLQDAAPAAQMSFGMLGRPIARGVEQRRRRPLSAEGAIVADIDPDATRDRLALGEDGNRRVVAMQALGGEDMRLDQRVQRRQSPGAGADVIGQRREAQIDAFASESARSAGSAADAARTSRTGSSPAGSGRQGHAEWDGTARAAA